VTALREIDALLRSDHPNIVKCKEIVTKKGDRNSFWLVMEYLEHDLKDLMGAMRDPYLQSEIKCLMLQLLSAVEYVHAQWWIHRDLKTSNLLLNNKGILKLCDFGLVRPYADPLGVYTQPVVTLWYRAPELLLGVHKYSWAIDMWSVGCIFAELLRKDPLMKGKSDIDQIDKIFQMLGTPTEDTWPGWNNLLVAKKVKWKRYAGKVKNEMGVIAGEAGFDLLMRFLTYDPEKRITAKEAKEHRYFKEHPLPRDPSMIQSHPSLHEGKKPVRRQNSSESLLFGASADNLALETQATSKALGIDPYGMQTGAGWTLKF